MLRYVLPALALGLALPLAQAASLKEMELTRTLEKVAQESSVGTPRAINEDILDQGHTLINHLSVRPAHAAKMRGNPDTVRSQLAASVCRNPGYRQLLSQGAQLRYQFSEYRSNRPITTEVFDRTDCAL
jgi:Putative quorum-sensing-regulated virulence factor